MHCKVVAHVSLRFSPDNAAVICTKSCHHILRISCHFLGAVAVGLKLINDVTLAVESLNLLYTVHRSWQFDANASLSRKRSPGTELNHATC